MTQKALLRKIKERAAQDQKYRRDRRFLDVMGFLVAKGLLQTNLDIHLMPNVRLRVDDAIWAGLNVEPRILEVLPAAVLRLGKHFDLDPVRHPALAQTVERLRKGEETGEAFLGVPYKKLKVWADFPLKDKRVKLASEKKIMKTFRLSPESVERLREVAKKQGKNETEVLEQLLVPNK